MATLAELGIAVPKENVVQKFTGWIRWADRETIKLDSYPLHSYSGVYVLAHIDNVSRDAADPVDPRIIYVGEGGRLKRRWYSFQRSIAEHAGHSGGHSYRRTFNCRTPKISLHVAAFPIWLKLSEPDPNPADPCSLTCRLRHYIEQALLWHHFYRKSGAALLNRK